MPQVAAVTVKEIAVIAGVEPLPAGPSLGEAAALAADDGGDLDQRAPHVDARGTIRAARRGR